jgi:hypothetical protein
MVPQSSVSGSDRELLERYMPVLVIFPHADPSAKKKLNHPSALVSPWTRWGDYHPCEAQFLLDRVTWGAVEKKRGVDVVGLLTLPSRRIKRLLWKAREVTGLEAIRARAKAAGADGTKDWELDISMIPSQTDWLAWEKYYSMISGGAIPYRAAVYGRVAATSSGKALQYWYLYAYNDFFVFNNHEADWEMVTIVLGRDGTPEQVGYSQHLSGSSQEWSKVKKTADGHPLVYVARGSHAGYFSHNPGGHFPLILNSGPERPSIDPLSDIIAKRLYEVLKWLRERPWLTQFRDFTPADPETDAGAVKVSRDFGVRLTPDKMKLHFLPPDQPPADWDDSDWWWLNLKCRWGSCQVRVFGAEGVIGPWAGSGEDIRWSDPAAWARSVPQEAVRLVSAQGTAQPPSASQK